MQPVKIDIAIGPVYSTTQSGFRSISSCVKELIEASYKIYSEIIKIGIPSTIICGGQSPSYYCLAMMNFSIYNSKLVNIVILPHSKFGEKSSNQYAEDMIYCNRLREKGINVRDNIYIIDGVHSGTGILALESALRRCFINIRQIKKIAINVHEGVSQIPVDYEVAVPCEPLFSDVFPRLVQAYYPKDFSDSSKFITEFIGLDTNLIAKMIIDIAINYPDIKIEDTEWFKINHDLRSDNFELSPEKILKSKEILRPKFYIPIVLTEPKRYQCPECNSISGTATPLEPTNLYLFSHNYNCPNKIKIPIEN